MNTTVVEHLTSIGKNKYQGHLNGKLYVYFISSDEGLCALFELAKNSQDHSAVGSQCKVYFVDEKYIIDTGCQYHNNKMTLKSTANANISASPFRGPALLSKIGDATAETTKQVAVNIEKSFTTQSK